MRQIKRKRFSTKRANMTGYGDGQETAAEKRVVFEEKIGGGKTQRTRMDQVGQKCEERQVRRGRLLEYSQMKNVCTSSTTRERVSWKVENAPLGNDREEGKWSKQETRGETEGERG